MQCCIKLDDSDAGGLISTGRRHALRRKWTDGAFLFSMTARQLQRINISVFGPFKLRRATEIPDTS
jgi:hypothetical protein